MKKMREIDYVFYMALLYIFSCLYGFFYKVIDILNFQNINFGYIGIFIIFIMSYLFLPIKHNKTMGEVVKFITKIIIGISLILMGMNYPKQWLISLIIYMISVLIILLVSQKKVKESINELELYPSRKTQGDILIYALENYNLIALDGTWGSGKTTFMDIVMKSNREKYYYISINIMLFENRNSLKTEFLNQLKGVFKEEEIFQGSLMDFDYYLDGVSNDWIKIVKNIIFSKSKSFKEANEKLKSEIGKIEKRIVVGVDNLERIYGESETEWKQILGFIHELQELGIKIVVMANLEEMLITNKKTEEKSLSNHEYFDKFYEFKLQLNEVTTEEIIDGVEDILEDDKRLIKKLFNSLTDSLRKKEIEINYKRKEITKGEIGRSLVRNPSEEDFIKRQIEVREKEKPLLELLLNLEKKYYENSKNPRKIEKIIEDIKLKKEIKKIHDIKGMKYEDLIFITSIFQLFYFDYYYRFKREGVAIFNDLLAESNPINKKYPIEDIFLEYIKYGFKNNIQVVNRLLYFEPEDEKVKDRVENLIEENKINIYDFKKYIEDIKIYSQRLDNSDMELTKEKYKIIQNNMVRLEKKYKENIHEIIKENEEFICKMNYLCYPDKVGIYEKVNYKFYLDFIFKLYNKEINKIKSIVLNNIDKNQSFTHETTPMELVGVNMNVDRIKKILFMYCEKTKNPILSSNELYEMTIYSTGDKIKLDVIITVKKLKEKLETREKNVFFKKNVEDVIFKKILVLLDILEKNEMQGNNDKIKNELDNWEDLNKNKRVEYLNRKLNEFSIGLKPIFKSNEMYTENEKIEGKLINIIRKEKDEGILLKLDDLLKIMNIRVFNEKLEGMFTNKEKKIDELYGYICDYINKELNKNKYNYIYEENIIILKGMRIEKEGSKFIFRESK